MKLSHYFVLPLVIITIYIVACSSNGDQKKEIKEVTLSEVAEPSTTSYQTITIVTCQVINSQIQGKYKGGCKNGLAHGKGESHGIDNYIGMFENGYMQGEGKYQWSNGDIYVGRFKKDLKEGHGKLFYKNSSLYASYEGDFANDLKSGTGILQFRDGSKFQGTFIDDRREKGTLYNRDGSIVRSPVASKTLSPTDVVKLETEKRIAIEQFRKDLQPGDQTSLGLVIEIKENRRLVLVQTTEVVYRSFQNYIANGQDPSSFVIREEFFPKEETIQKWVRMEEIFPLKN
ncbi:MAG: hypothetical protein BWK78_03275 [Thiotrichaceae bacterium IS1]|nr:MAG: hypothetical protein BWK78_03275 [Thiotrichaceae bacterium IS1]